MGRSLARDGIAVLALAALGACGGHSPSTSAQEDSLTALKKLRDSGVLTQAEYDAKVASAGAQNESLAALKTLRERGVLSQGEYDEKAAALRGDGSAGLGARGGLGESSSATPAAGAPLGQPDAAGLAAQGSRIAEATPPPAPARQAPRAMRKRTVAQASPQAPEPPANVEPAAEAPSPPEHRSGMRNFLTEAKTKEAAMARSAHDLALRMFGRSRAPQSVPPIPTPEEAQALKASGDALLRGGGTGLNDPATQNPQPPAQR
jgi:Short C-terminal domain